LISSLRSTGPASIEVWISSPVRSRKPVLMKNTLRRAAWIAALRLAEVRRSSSMMPILMVSGGSSSIALDRAEHLAGEGDLVRPVHLGLDDIDSARARIAALVMHGAEDGDGGIEQPSPIGLPSGSRTASVVIRWPTLRTSCSAAALEREVTAAAAR
jgi:hypothetical protein